MPATRNKLHSDALAIFQAGLGAANAGAAVRRALKRSGSKLTVEGGPTLQLDQFKRILVVGAGKAGAAMSAALEETLDPGRITAGVVNVKYAHADAALRAIELVECSHPIPDESGVAGVRRMEGLLGGLTRRDLIFVLLSGGASALLPAPASLSLSEKQKTTDLLLRAGADIVDLNIVRKHLSRWKGGGFAALAAPATVVALILSDVIGDRIDVIGSGITAPDPSTFGDALRVLARFHLTKKIPRAVLDRLEEGSKGRLAETPKPGDRVFRNVHNVIVGSNRLALRAAAKEANQRRYRVVVLSSSMQGETREVARVHCEILREALETGSLGAPPLCLLAGGETTVTVRGKGKGGRNQEFALAAAIALRGMRHCTVLSAGTDGTDGPTDAAGAISDGTTMERAEAAGLQPGEHLDDNDAYPLFEALGDLVKTGSTGTNVMDLHVLLGGAGKSR